MTVTVTDVLAGPFYPNGVTTTFPFDFKVSSIAEVRPFFVSLGGSEVEVPNGAYTVSIAADGEGGVITFPAAPLAAAGTFWVEPAPSFTQPASFTNNGFLPRTLNPLFDRLVTYILWLRTRMGRTILLPRFNSGAQISQNARGILGVFDGNVSVTPLLDVLNTVGIDVINDGTWGGETTSDGVWG